MSLFDLENDLPDELRPNGDLGMGMSSNGGPGAGPGLNSVVPDAAAKHKQLSELLRPGSSNNLGGGLPQGSMVGNQLGGVLGKNTLGQGSPNHQSPQGQKGGPGQGNGSAGMGFNQPMGQVHGGMGQTGQVINGAMGPAGRGRPGLGMQYQGQAMQGTQVGAGPGAGSSVVGDALTQGGPQMGAHNTMSAQQAGNMNKVRFETLLS